MKEINARPYISVLRLGAVALALFSVSLVHARSVTNKDFWSLNVSPSGAQTVTFATNGTPLAVKANQALTPGSGWQLGSSFNAYSSGLATGVNNSGELLLQGVIKNALAGATDSAALTAQAKVPKIGLGTALIAAGKLVPLVGTAIALNEIYDLAKIGMAKSGQAGVPSSFFEKRTDDSCAGHAGALAAFNYQVRPRVAWMMIWTDGTCVATFDGIRAESYMGLPSTATGNQPITDAVAAQKLQDFLNANPATPKIAEAVKEALNLGQPIPVEQPTVIGPQTVVGPTTTTTAPDGTQTQKTTKYDCSYATDTVTCIQTDSSKLTLPDGTKQDGPTTVQDRPKTDSPASDLCKDHPTIIACQELGEVPERDVLKKVEHQVQVVATEFASAASCPTGPHFSVFGKSFSVEYGPFCNLMLLLRPIILALSFAAAAFVLADSFKV